MGSNTSGARTGLKKQQLYVGLVYYSDYSLLTANLDMPRNWVVCIGIKGQKNFARYHGSATQVGSVTRWGHSTQTQVATDDTVWLVYLLSQDGKAKKNGAPLLVGRRSKMDFGVTADTIVRGKVGEWDEADNLLVGNWPNQYQLRIEAGGNDIRMPFPAENDNGSFRESLRLSITGAGTGGGFPMEFHG